MASLLRTASVRALAASGSQSGSRVMLLHTSRIAFSKDPQLGDYPDIEPVSRQLRKHSPHWWDKQEKANFGETLHEQDDVLSVWAPDLHERVKPSSALFQFLVAAGVAGLFASFIYVSVPAMPAVRRSYPRDGLATELGGSQVAARTGAEDEEGEEEEEEE